MAWERWMVCHASYCAAPKALFFRRMPADGGGIKEQVGAAQGGDARRFRIPLVPTDQRAHLSDRSIEGLEAQVARA